MHRTRLYKNEPQVDFRELYYSVDSLKEHEIQTVVETLGALSMTEQEITGWKVPAGGFSNEHNFYTVLEGGRGLTITTNPESPDTVKVDIFNDRLNGRKGFPKSIWFYARKTAEGLQVTQGALVYSGILHPVLVYRPAKPGISPVKYSFENNQHDKFTVPAFFSDATVVDISEKFIQAAQTILEKNNIDLHAEK